MPFLSDRPVLLGYRHTAAGAGKASDPEEAAARLVNLVTAWKHEIKEMMGGMGINSIEALRGNRVMLRGIHLNEKELEILGIAHAGE